MQAHRKIIDALCTSLAWTDKGEARLLSASDRPLDVLYWLEKKLPRNSDRDSVWRHWRYYVDHHLGVITEIEEAIPKAATAKELKVELLDFANEADKFAREYEHQYWVGYAHCMSTPTRTWGDCVEPRKNSCVSHTGREIGRKPEFTCCVCLKPLERKELLVFGGTFACEDCVREHYDRHEPLSSDSEVQLRRREAAYLLRRLRPHAARSGEI